MDPGPIDVEIVQPHGRRLVATFATIVDIERLIGAAFWCADLIVVPKLSVEAVVQAVEQLARDGELTAAFAEAESPRNSQTG